MQAAGSVTSAASHPMLRKCQCSAPRPAGGPERLSRWAPTRPQRRLQAQRMGQPPPDENEDKEGAAGPPSGSSGNVVKRGLEDLGTLASNLLMNAASWRVVRGQTYCVECRGTGRVTCSACQGAGIVQQEKVQTSQVAQAASKLKVLLGGNDTKIKNESDWIKSNRCKCCKGSGTEVCKQCEGSGVRGPAGA